MAAKVKTDALNEDIVELLRKHDPDGRLTARQVAELANRCGYRTGQGNLWTVDRIFRHLRRARCALAAETSAVAQLDEV